MLIEERGAVGALFSLPPEDRAQAFRVALAHRSCEHFIRLTDPKFIWNWHHLILADKLTALAAGRIKRLAVSMPRRHVKSARGSKKFPVFVVARAPCV